MKIPGIFLIAPVLAIGLSVSVHAADSIERTAGKDFTDIHSKTTIYPKWFKDTFWDLNDDIAEAQKAGKTGIMIYTSTKTCTYCIAFIEKSLNDPVIQKRLRAQFDVLGLEVIADTEITDVDGKTYVVKDFLKKYKAYFTPTQLFFGKDGKLLLSIAGYYPPERFMKVLDYLEGKHYERESWRDYSARLAGDTNKSAIHFDKTLFSKPADNLDRRNGKATKPLLVLFEKPGCDACREMHEQVLSVKTTRDWIARFDASQLDASDDKALITRPDGSKATASQWARELNIAYYPSYVFFDETGAEVFRLDTYTRNVRLEGALELVLTRGYQDEPQLQRWRRQQFVEQLSGKEK